MTVEAIINQFENNKYTFKGLLQNKTIEEYLWRPQDNKWNILEIACHLLDEEQKDFRARIRYVFDQPDYDMPPINPEAWVVEHDYKSKVYNTVVETFLNERQQSIIWLRSKESANWEKSIMHPKLGKMTASLFLANWLAHDYLHIRQILNVQYNFLKSKSGLNLDYAGNW